MAGEKENLVLTCRLPPACLTPSWPAPPGIQSSPVTKHPHFLTVGIGATKGPKDIFVIKLRYGNWSKLNLRKKITGPDIQWFVCTLSVALVGARRIVLLPVVGCGAGCLSRETAKIQKFDMRPIKIISLAGHVGPIFRLHLYRIFREFAKIFLTFASSSVPATPIILKWLHYRATGKWLARLMQTRSMKQDTTDNGIQ